MHSFNCVIFSFISKFLHLLSFSFPNTVIPTVLSKSHTLRNSPMAVEEVDLFTVWQPYLIVRGYPKFANKQMLHKHFEKGSKVQSVEMKEQEALIFYEDAKGRLPSN